MKPTRRLTLQLIILLLILLLIQFQLHEEENPCYDLGSSHTGDDCPEFTMTVEERGDTGNLMTQYATLYAIAAKYQYFPIIPQVSSTCYSWVK